MDKYAIKITYSWGDEEEPVKIPEGKDAYEEMLNLALRELRIELTEHCGEGTASICATEEGIDLTYCDGEICRYNIVGADYKPHEDNEMEITTDDGRWEKDYANQ